MISDQSTELPALVTRGLKGLVVVGLLTCVAGLYLAPHRTWANALLSSYFVLELSVAAMLFIAMHTVSGARWNLSFTTIPRAMVLALPIGAAGVLLVLVAHPSLYPWVGAAPTGEGAMAFKHWWLSRTFFLGRSVVYLACWTGLAFVFARGWRHHRSESVALSAGALVAVALTLVPASFDWLMSLQPDWYSTIFGIYEFASMFLAGIAAIILLGLPLRRLIPAAVQIDEDQIHDLGKLLFAFSTFWAYIWFCQYMLIWYGNISEETAYFVARQQGRWTALSVLSVVLSWALPFSLLLSRRAKRTEGRLLSVAAIVLAGRLVDLYLQILPPVVGSQPRIGLPEIGPAAAAIGLYLLTCFKMLELR